MAKVIHNSDKEQTTAKGSQAMAAYSAVSRLLSGYESGFELVRGEQPNAVERFVVISIAGTPRLLLPSSADAMRTAVNGFLGQRRFAHLLPSFARVASWAGTKISMVDVNMSLISHTGQASPLRELISGVLGRNDFQIAMRLSFGRPNAKTVAMAISEAGDVLCYAKFGSESMTNDLVAHEGSVLERYQGMTMPLIMPELLYADCWAGEHNVLITAPLQLEPLGRDASAAHKAADNFTMNQLLETAPLAKSNYWQQIAMRVKELENQGTNVEGLMNHVACIEQIWGDSCFDFGASHGDWSRANLGMVDSRIAAFDWERCTELAPGGIDTAHFAIYEKPTLAFSKALDIERIADNLRTYQSSAGLQPTNVKPLILLALLEMVIRFKSAQIAGMKANDFRFEPALIAGLQKWPKRGKA